MAGIGFGMQGIPNMQAFLQKDEVQWVAVCDIDKNHLKEAQDIVNQHYGNEACATYHDFRELYARGDLDAVSIAVPDHWHAILSISAARAGLDIYGEKPFTHSLVEGRAMCDAVKRYGRVWQTGSWQRSVDNFHRACELVRNGRIGKILRVEVGLPQGHYDFARTFGQWEIKPPPPELDYDFWVGPAPYVPYCKARVHMNWRWNMDFGGGQLMDWIGHHLDIAHWGLGFDYTGPVEIEGRGEFPTSGIYNSALRYWVDDQVRRRDADHHRRRLRRNPGRDEMDRRIRLDLGGPGRVRNPARLSRQRDHRPERDPADQEPRPLPELPGLRQEPRPDHRRRARSPTARRASAISASSPSKRAGRSRGTRPRKRSAATPEANGSSAGPTGNPGSFRL